MPRCKDCDHPYYIVTKCTNFGSKNPTEKKGNFIGGLIAILIFVAINQCI